LDKMDGMLARRASEGIPSLVYSKYPLSTH